jgi:hypothetical protein
MADLQPSVVAALNDVRSRLAAGTLSVEYVRDLAGKLSVELASTVDIFVLYSGEYISGVTAHDAALSLAAQSSRVGIIDNTAVAQFLDNADLKAAVRQVLGGDLTATNNLFFEGASSLWGEASQRFAESGHGNLIVLTGPNGYNAQGSWAQAEFHTALYNTKFENVVGLDRVQLVHALGAPRAFVGMSSHESLLSAIAWLAVKTPFTR